MLRLFQIWGHLPPLYMMITVDNGNVLNFPSLLSCSSYQHFSDNVQTQKRGALAALQLAPSRSRPDNAASYLLFSQTLAKTLRQICAFAVWNINTIIKNPFPGSFIFPELLHVLLPIFSLASLTKWLSLDYHACLIRAQTIPQPFPTLFQRLCNTEKSLKFEE